MTIPTEVFPRGYKLAITCVCDRIHTLDPAEVESLRCRCGAVYEFHPPPPVCAACGGTGRIGDDIPCSHCDRRAA